MKIRNTFTIATRALQRNKMRTALTSIGIIIGVSSVIMMVGIGNSARIAVRAKIATFGTNAISMMSFFKPFTEQDLKAIKEEIPEIQYVTPTNYYEFNIKRLNKNAVRKVMGVSNDYFHMNNWVPENGTFFSDEEIRSYEKIVIIGSSIKKEFFDNEDPIGKVIHINQIPFKVVGCLAEKGLSISGRDMDSIVLGPYTTLSVKLFPIKTFVGIYASTYGEDQIDIAKKKLIEYYRRKNQLPSGELQDLSVASSNDAIKTAEEISNILTSLLAGIASISLFVGGVGIMNIMLASVSERTREIGIRMAIGAKNRDILMQFLLESVVISSMGGFMGITFGLLIYFLITLTSNQPFIFSPGSVFSSFLFAMAVGIVFGYYPARKASMLNPIEALRHE